jgi:hypothetical protein
LKLALEGNLPELHEETPEALTGTVLPPVAGIDLPVAHQ